MIKRCLGDGFYLELHQLNRDSAPYWRLMEIRRFWFDKMHAWSESDERLERKCRQIKYARERWKMGLHK